tara:strand:- start:46 stop:534 length:489 start_codon:yes stop_codon:yes gene_type:complete
MKKINEKYVPKSLSKEDKKKQIKSIKEQTIRPKLDSFKSKRSNHVIKFEKTYGYKITEKTKIAKDLLSMAGIKKVIEKGNAAYFSGGSRPNQTPASWSNARLASVLTFGKAADVDKDILLKYGKGDILKKAIEKYTHKMPDGKLMSGKEHNKNSKEVKIINK